MNRLSKTHKYPLLYQINTRVWLKELSASLGRNATLDDIPDGELDHIAELGFDWIWLLSVWTTGEQGRKVSLENPVWRTDFEHTLPDLKDDDIGGSGFAIAGYHVHPDLGGDSALDRLRTRMKKRGLKLMLDFVPNHLGPDHPWVSEHPGYFIQGTETDLKNSPRNYKKISGQEGDLIFAYGRDPYFDGWPDTFQLDYSNPELVHAMMEELLHIAGQCDGLRCDMAMLILPDIFERTWGKRSLPFWEEIITTIHHKIPGFTFLAEVYWDMEWDMQQQGFDYAYDKRLYDRLVEGNAKSVREHFYAGPEYQDKLARFLENHDETRAASIFEPEKHKAAALITYLSPGLKFFHQGQFEGRLKRISPHLVRAPLEYTDAEISEFYGGLLNILRQAAIQNGFWKLLHCRPAWEGNFTWDSFIAFSWENKDNEKILVTVNYAPYQGQCYVQLPLSMLKSTKVRFEDMMNSIIYEQSSTELIEKGLFLDMNPWSYHVFLITW